MEEDRWHCSTLFCMKLFGFSLHFVLVAVVVVGWEMGGGGVTSIKLYFLTRFTLKSIIFSCFFKLYFLLLVLLLPLTYNLYNNCQSVQGRRAVSVRRAYIRTNIIKKKKKKKPQKKKDEGKLVTEEERRKVCLAITYSGVGIREVTRVIRL